MRRVALLVLLVLLYLPALGNSASGTHPDEAWHLGTSAEMQAKGEWFTPTLDDVPNWHKPPLFYWSEQVAYTVLGTNLFAARLPSALAWIAVVLLVLALGRRMYGEEGGLLAAVLTATAFGWVKYARLAMMDAPMALGLALAAYGTWRAAEEDDPPGSSRWEWPPRWTSSSRARSERCSCSCSRAGSCSSATGACSSPAGRPAPSCSAR